MSAGRRHDNGALSDGWRVVRLGDVSARPEYGASAPASPWDPDLPRYVRITDITDDGRLRVDGACCADPKLVRGYELAEGDLLFARSGSVGRTYLYKTRDGPCVFAGYLIRFRPDPDVALPRYVDCYTHSESYRRWVASMLRVGAQPNINAAEYSALSIPLPPLPEQRVIADVLDSIDEAIERTEAVIRHRDPARLSAPRTAHPRRPRLAHRVEGRARYRHHPRRLGSGAPGGWGGPCRERGYPTRWEIGVHPIRDNVFTFTECSFRWFEIGRCRVHSTRN